MLYNKPDTKLRANVKGGQLKIKRAVYGKQFKMAAVKQQKHWTSAEELCAGGSTNMPNMEKVRFQGMETHFLSTENHVIVAWFKGA